MVRKVERIKSKAEKPFHQNEAPSCDSGFPRNCNAPSLNWDLLLGKIQEGAGHIPSWP
jgi:hypothetical protein